MDVYGSAQEKRTAYRLNQLNQPNEGPIATESPVSRELGAVVNGLAEVEQLVQTLRARLAPVLCLKPPSEMNMAKPQTLNATGSGAVADSLYGSNQRISDIGRELQSIISDLAV